jgi:Ni,Fe-hydrogenase III small subunit/formate hydrogenlyase subunit 6/NADH:ubiquinone oxidoreductase subunit I
MFKILQKAVKTGIVTAAFPPPAQPDFRGKPVFDLENWRDARPAAKSCPTGAISIEERVGHRQVTIDYGRCIFCGECAEASPEAVRMSHEFTLAVGDRRVLILTAEYVLGADGTQQSLMPAGTSNDGRQKSGQKLSDVIHKTLGRSLAIREVDAGSCNGCELEIMALTNPVHDIERFGIHFVASPRHADMLLVTGPVTRNMETALRKTYAAMPEPKVVVAVGACGISGGIFGKNYACLGAVSEVIPVDVYVPGCPPRPEALLDGILLAVGRIAGRST